MESPFFTAMSKVADFIILNLLFILCSIPIITMGASMTALSYVMLKMKEDEEGYLVRSFFKSFKANFLQATAIWLIMLVIAFGLFMDWRILGAGVITGTFVSIMRVFLMIGAIVWLMIVIYVFPMVARYENTTAVMFKNAVLLALGNAPKTILMILILGVCLAATLWSGTTIAWGILIWLMVGFSLLAFVNATLLIKVFHKIEPDKEDETDDLEFRVEDTVMDAADIAAQNSEKVSDFSEGNSREN